MEKYARVSQQPPFSFYIEFGRFIPSQILNTCGVVPDDDGANEVA